MLRTSRSLVSSWYWLGLDLCWTLVLEGLSGRTAVSTLLGLDYGLLCC